ncbi:MAG: hypothetical protein RL499_1019, partial [Actinomycetota bacterium]
MVSDDNDKTAKKRTRLFASRAPKKASDHAAKGEPGFDAGALAEPADEVTAPTTALTTDAAPAESAEVALANEALAEGAPADDAPADTAPADAAPAAPAFPELKPESTTSLLFFAPPVEAVAPRGSAAGRGT